MVPKWVVRVLIIWFIFSALSTSTTRVSWIGCFMCFICHDISVSPSQKCAHRFVVLHLSSYYNDVIMGAMASQITSLTIVYSTVYSATDEKTSKLLVTGLCEGNSPVTGDIPAQRASNAENVSIWWHHYEKLPWHVSCSSPRYSCGTISMKFILALLLNMSRETLYWYIF